MKTEKTIQVVLNDGLCTACGTCAAICPVEAIAMVERDRRNVRPRIDAERCTSCGQCVALCPGLKINREQPVQGDPFVGLLTAAYIGRSSDPAILDNAQSGGMVTSYLLHALDTGFIDAALVTVMPQDGSLRPRIHWATTRDELLEAQQSKYCPVPVNTVLRDILQKKKRVALVGLSCHMHGIWNVMQANPDLQKYLVLRVGLVCDRVMTFGAIDHLLRRAQLAGEPIRSFQYRSKAWRGWPGDVAIETQGGRRVNLPREERMSIKEQYTPHRCRLCFDKLNTYADIVFCDPYGLSEDSRGSNGIWVRSEAAHQLFLDGMEQKKFYARPVDAYRILKGQGLDLRKNNFTLFSVLWKQMGHRLPGVGFDFRLPKLPKQLNTKPFVEILQRGIHEEQRMLSNDQ